MTTTTLNETGRIPPTTSLDEDTAHDVRVLAKFFHETRTRWIGRYGLEGMGLMLSGRALVNLGLLVGDKIGRYDDGYRPAGALLDELIRRRNEADPAPAGKEAA